MRIKSMEEKLIAHCAPTLAGMKSAGLFSYFYKEEEKVREELDQINELLNPRGLYVDALVWREKSVLIYAYRPLMLRYDWEDTTATKILKDYGYPCGEATEITDCIRFLRKRVCECACFPHEIGIFLGYPPEDVKGFIENGGQNCKSCGLWKVYCEEEKKSVMFQRFRKCTEVYQKVFQNGRTIAQMTVMGGSGGNFRPASATFFFCD